VTLYRVRHVTEYDYGEPVVISHNEAHLVPRRLDTQEVTDLQLRIDPQPATVKWHADYFGNPVVFFALQAPHDRLRIESESSVELRPLPPFDPLASPPWEQVAQAARRPADAAALAATEFRFASPLVPLLPELAEHAQVSFPPGRPFAQGLLDLAHRIHTEFHYDPGATTLETPVLDVLRLRRGVCQDFAHVMIGSLRALDLPARYVSGYLRTRSDSDPADEEPTLVGAEASHAWVAGWCPVLGWLPVDPTNDLVPTDRHVTLGWGRDYDDVSPVKGVTVGGGAQRVDVRVEVRPLP